MQSTIFFLVFLCYLLSIVWVDNGRSEIAQESLRSQYLCHTRIAFHKTRSIDSSSVSQLNNISYFAPLGFDKEFPIPGPNKRS